MGTSWMQVRVDTAVLDRSEQGSVAGFSTLTELQCDKFWEEPEHLTVIPYITSKVNAASVCVFPHNLYTSGKAKRIDLSLCICTTPWRLRAFLTSALDGGKCTFTPGCFTSGKRAPGTHWMGGWVSPRAGEDTAMAKNISSSAGNRTPVVQPVA